MSNDKHKLCVIFDIDETLIHFVQGTYRPLWNNLHSEIKNKLRVVDKKNSIIILRPYIEELFNYFKENLENINVGLWTYSEREYSEDIANVLTRELNLPEDFFLFTWGAEDMESTEDGEEFGLPKDLTKVYKTFVNFNKFNTFLVDDLYRNLTHHINRHNCILIQPFAIFGTSKVRADIGSEKQLMMTNDDAFRNLINVCEVVLRDIKGCSIEDLNDSFTTESVFGEKRVRRMRLEALLKTYAVAFIKMLTIGEPMETNDFIMINTNNYLPHKKGGVKNKKNGLYSNNRHKITKKRRR